MKPSNIGGQAVMEGIMMRHKDKYAVAVRRPDKEIEIKVEDYKCTFGRAGFLKWPIIRGVVSFVDGLVVGTKCLMYSAVPVASLHNCGNFNHIFCGCIYVVTVCTGQSASEGWSLRVWRNSSRSIREARAFPGIYVSDFQNERYSENIYVPRCRA